MGRSWPAVRRAWGFAAADEPKVRRGLLAEALLFTLIGMLGIWVAVHLAHHPGAAPSYWPGLLCLPVGLVGGITRWWRYRVVRHQRFVPFGEWLTGRSEEKRDV